MSWMYRAGCIKTA